MLLQDLRSNTTVLCKGFIDGITQYKNVAKVWPYANNHAVN